ncbi:hypothetical protein Aca07nite_33580 [Actinoplanes capillaceus]|uniref:Uncharacterized protein n=1 Tax=Actinoplanes campanulatus TaxID=113559 RepID=A0ABQ3WIL3_9ACTN|nr:hypothetical protein Aca07nite_33580 [Actinoplanes capillaceus]
MGAHGRPSGWVRTVGRRGGWGRTVGLSTVGLTHTGDVVCAVINVVGHVGDHDRATVCARRPVERWPCAFGAPSNGGRVRSVPVERRPRALAAVERRSPATDLSPAGAAKA